MRWGQSGKHATISLKYHAKSLQKRFCLTSSSVLYIVLLTVLYSLTFPKESLAPAISDCKKTELGSAVHIGLLFWTSLSYSERNWRQVLEIASMAADSFHSSIWDSVFNLVSFGYSHEIFFIFNCLKLIEICRTEARKASLFLHTQIKTEKVIWDFN